MIFYAIFYTLIKPYLRVLIDILHEWMEVRKMDSDGSTQIYRQMFIERERAESVFLPEI